MKNLMNASHSLQEYLINQQMTQAAFGKGIEVTQGMVGQWLRSERPVSVAAALKIEETYGIKADVLSPIVRRLRTTQS